MAEVPKIQTHLSVFRSLFVLLEWSAGHPKYPKIKLPLVSLVTLCPLKHTNSRSGTEFSAFFGNFQTFFHYSLSLG
jgi:hypothetical protein